MKRESVQALKRELRARYGVVEEGRGDRAGLEGRARGTFRPAEDVRGGDPARCHLSFGIAGTRGNHKLAVTVHHGDAVPEALDTALQQIEKRAPGRVVVKKVGRVHGPPRELKKKVPEDDRWERGQNRPLLIGSSLAHASVSVGTLACFVTRRHHEDQARPFVLSNNHILAHINQAKTGDPILQPAVWDAHGEASGGKVAELTDFVPLKPEGNLMDAAVAAVDPGIAVETRELKGLGALSGVRTEALHEGDVVFKVGRTSGVTRGTIAAVEMDGVAVVYPGLGGVRFDNQLEIIRADDTPFGEPGDSGAIVVDESFKAVGLLFASNEGEHVTYASPIAQVLEALDIELLL